MYCDVKALGMGGRDMRRTINTLVWLLLIMLQHSCSAGASSGSPCQRSCGNRPVGGGNLKGFAYTSELKFLCAGGGTLPQQTLHFLIYEDTKEEAANNGGAGGNNAGQESSGAQLPERLPKGGIAFTPSVPSLVTLDTPSSDWCTDSCGIAEIKITPICANIGEGIIMPIVPGMTSDTLPKTTYSNGKPL